MFGTRGRRKPSRWWKTTRAERDIVGGIHGPKDGDSLVVPEWTVAGTSDEGTSRTNPRRGKSNGHRKVCRALAPRRERRRRDEGEEAVRRIHQTIRRTP
jgi:hypothetical protein